MKIMCPLWIVLGSVALLHVGGGQAVAQVELGGAASVNNVRGGTFGLGGRLGVPVRQSFNMGVRLEAAVDYYWPSCSSQVDCDAIDTRLDVVFENRIGGGADTYFGVGVTYQNLTLQQDDQTVAEGDFWGGNFVVGSRYVTQTDVRPFLEVRWTVLDDIDNQWAVTFGATVALGR
jgi:hypothetical protein